MHQTPRPARRFHTDAADLLDRLHTDVAYVRERRGLTAHQAAKQIGIGPVMLCRLETGEHGVTIRTAAAILRWIAAPAQPGRSVGRTRAPETIARLTQPCPTCGATAGNYCTTIAGTTIRRESHRTRPVTTLRETT